MSRPEPEYYCPECNCDLCVPLTASYKADNEELLRKVSRLENHIVGQDKIIAELSKSEVTS
jgi:hypothetical protein